MAEKENHTIMADAGNDARSDERDEDGEPIRRPPPRRGRAMSLADLVAQPLKPAMRRRGFASTDLFIHWADIVGPVFAGWTSPERLSWPKRMEVGGEDGFEPAVLTVACEGARALLLQHEAPKLVERINATFGYGAVGRIRILQKPVERMQSPAAPRQRPLGPGEEQRLSRILDGIKDPDLRRSLEKLGRGVLSSKKG
jgi:hypothetical protein